MISNYPSTTLLFMIVSMLGITGWYAALLQPFMPAWLAVGIFILPIVLVLFLQWGEAPPRIVARAHIAAASIFTLLSGGMELGRFFDYRPEGDWLFKVIAHLGWMFAWGAIFKKARRHQKATSEK